ncbi:MAG TPA: CDP-glycerol glycerophosphotransferase family protein [Candidatus Marinimicrobia bacterium]|nr:CDP-glycerol glycerophosphotransferase family protein [Candidatus Neomarinimicrobiota bacterium]HRS52120.1 CDP-glycerol glycerophosphotransferase family protein [Candidatus Neomarinimicrobiota bacterium]HRU92503.1 CDP-glycerol glycerophosphotransferase family protein [Candidatus Neomarinimicrobiota bacterium]
MRYLFFITKPYSISVIRPLYEEIRREARGEALIFATPPVKALIDFEAPSTDSIRTAIDFQPEVVFVPGNFVYDKIPGLKVQIFHGLCEEKGGHYKITGFFDLYCTSGPLITEKFQQLSKKYGYFKVKETGWPKVDDLLKPYDRSELCQRLQLDPHRKIILYAPTFSPKFKSSNEILKVISDLPHSDEQWIIKFHDLMPSEDRRSFEKLPHEKFRIYNGYDNTSLLQIADVLISDTSSIVYEFMLLDKPVITIGAKVRQEKALNIESAENLRAAIERSLENPQEFAENRRQTLAQIHPYIDTLNSQRVLNAVDDFLRNTTAGELKKKPLNLYRKYKVRRQLGVWF